MAKKNDAWFKAKHYGWGWYPATWQAWTILGLYVFSIVMVIRFANEYAKTGADFYFFAFMPIFALTTLLIAIAYHTGEKPRWSWGKHR